MTSHPRPALPWSWLGRLPYDEARSLQDRRRDRLIAGEDAAACLLLLEHDPVITLGRRADPSHVVASAEELAARGVATVPTNRGGDVTYHGPGQLVVYPVIRLTAGVVAYLEALAAGLAALADELGVPGARWQRSPAGLWLGDAKLAACGIHVRRGVASHGWAINVATPPDAWALIVPCGIDAPVTSIAEVRAARGLTPPPPLEQVALRAAEHVCAALGYSARAAVESGGRQS